MYAENEETKEGIMHTSGVKIVESLKRDISELTRTKKLKINIEDDVANKK